MDATFVCRVMPAQIQASKIVQRGLLARWRDEPISAPTSRQELSGVRPTLDAIDEEFVVALTAPRSPRTGQGRALEDLDNKDRLLLASPVHPDSGNGSAATSGWRMSRARLPSVTARSSS
jgi:hypothetical protein